MERVPVIATPADALALFADLANGARERLAAAWLDARGGVIASVAGPPEGVCSATMPVAGLLRQAVAYGAADLIVAHNHPGGDPAPSHQDVRATRRLAMGAQAIGVRLLDHLVIAGGAWSSFRLLGLL
jgi:DNA repair protein RadC